MSGRSRTLCLWLLLGALGLAIALPLWVPLRRAWLCYRQHDAGDRARGELVKKLKPATLVLVLQTGPQAGHACTAKTSRAIHAAAEPGETFAVVTREDRPGDCVLESTLTASAWVLWSITGGLGALGLGIVGLGLFLQRSFTRPGVPQRRMNAGPGPVSCPVCDAPMAEGYLPLVAGVHWRDRGEPLGLPHALAGLPGTVGWRGRPRLHAFRCAGCEIVTFQYGKP